MTGEARSDWACRIDRTVGERWERLNGRGRINALQPRRSVREPRSLLAAALNPERAVGRVVYPNVARTVSHEVGRHALAAQLATVGCPGEGPAGTFATSVLDTRSPLLAADEVARRRRTGSDHQTHGAQSRLASRVDAGAEAADVAASATMIRIGRGISASRVGRWGDGVGARVHGRIDHRGVSRRGAAHAGHTLIRRDGAGRADVTHTSSHPDAAFVIVVSARGHEHHTDQNCGREKTTLNRDAHADFPSADTLPRPSERGNDAESRGTERNMTGEASSDRASRIDRKVGEGTRLGACCLKELRQGPFVRKPAPGLLAAALNPERSIGLVDLNIARSVKYAVRRHALAAQFAAVRCPGVRVSGVSAAPVLDARTPLFTADVITGRRGVESDAKAVCAQAGLTRRVDALAKLADDSAATAVVGVGRGVSTSRVPRVAGVTVRAAVGGCVDGRIDTDGSAHPRHALVVERGTGRSDAAKTARFADWALSVVVSACGHERHTNQDCGREKTRLNRDVHADFPSADTLPRGSEHGNDTESQLRERNMTGDPNLEGVARIDRQFRWTWAEFEGRRGAVQQRRPSREPRPLLAAASNPKWRVGFVHPNVAWPIKNREDRRHALASRLVAVRCPGERPSGTLATSVLDARSPLLAADLIAGRERPDSRHATHRTESRLAHRVDAGAEAANVAASATVIRIGRGISTSRIRRRGDGVGACIHGGTVHRGVPRRRTAHAGQTLIRLDGAGRADVTHTSRHPDAAIVIVVSTRGRDHHTDQDCGREQTTLNRDAHADFPSADTLPRASEHGNDTESQLRERNMTGDPNWGGAARIDRRFRGTWVESQGRRQISSALQQRRSMRGPRETLLAAALNPKRAVGGFVNPNIAWAVNHAEERRHALAARCASVRRPREGVPGVRATSVAASVLDTRSPLLAADQVTRRRRTGADHQTHGTQSRLARRVDAGAEAADVAASAAVIRIGCRVSASRVGRWGDGVGARVHGRIDHRGVSRRGAAHAGHTLIRRDGAGRADVTHTSSHPDAAFVIVVSARGHEHHTDQNCGREKTTLNRDAHADFPSVRTVPRTSERGNETESQLRERNMTSEASSDWACCIDRRDGERWARLEGRCRINALQQRQSMRGPRPLLAAALNPERAVGRVVYPNVAGTVGYEDGRHALAGQFAAVRRPRERPSGALATSVLDTRPSLLAADQVTRRRRTGSDHQTHGTQSWLARRVDAGAETADVAASATVIRIGRGISASRIWRRGDRVGARVNGGTVHRGVPRRGAAHAGHALIRLDRARRADVTHTFSRPDAALVVVVSTRGRHEETSREQEGREMGFDRKGHCLKPRRPTSHADRVTATASRECPRSET
mgnify:CR=1 FL=1